MMSKNELIAKIEALQEWEALLDEAKKEVEQLRNSIKEEMITEQTSELVAGRYIVRFTPVISNRFDTTSFKRVYGNLYNDFVKSVESYRFSISK